jgi:hypothetical protein
MRGSRIQLAKEALNYFLLSLRSSGTYFNVCSFGQTHKFLFPAEVTVEYTQKNIDLAVQQIEKYDAK